ncbi:MAG: YolD-like family protein [Acetivibrio ethanolgignens]
MSRIRPKMEQSSRAKQFMPFEALKGFREALLEKERIIVPKRELSEDQKAELDYKLRQLRRMDMVTAEYFQNGEYVQLTGVVSGIDETSRVLRIVNTKIPFEAISDLQGDMFIDL